LVKTVAFVASGSHHWVRVLVFLLIWWLYRGGYSGVFVLTWWYEGQKWTKMGSNKCICG